jgi:hypothetical protein
MFNHERDAAVAAAHTLGWASIGIGLAELVAPDRVESLLGIENGASHRGMLRVLGMRELMHGAGILTEAEVNRQLTAGVWSRVAGDVLDCALLGIAATRTRRPLAFAAVAAAVTAIGVADVCAALKLSRQRHRGAD